MHTERRTMKPTETFKRDVSKWKPLHSVVVIMGDNLLHTTQGTLNKFEQPRLLFLAPVNKAA